MAENAFRRSRPGTRARRLGAVLALAGLAVGCGGQDGSGTTPSGSSVSSTTSTGSASVSPTTTSTAPTTSPTAPTTASPTTLPGESIFSFARDGDELAVMGIAYDDVLNVRALPGTNAPIVARLAPTATDAVATGRARRLPASIWSEVRVGPVTGWANTSYLGFMAGTDDATAQFLRGASPPRAPTLQALGELVAARFAPADREPGLRIVQSTPATVGDLGEITYDVIGVADDSTAGYRLHVFATPADGAFVLRTIERTEFCWRGADGERCI